ncbi:cysteine-rich CWC family protein [Vibrio fluminensis]|uniref:cysteine-rich CWC family protein n=1 Tax=Vibrio fluminensis TaxID=2783614 RepID=UPI0018878779|nr:cysteine-rich CWC family protein [Vibrio fluminensis]
MKTPCIAVCKNNGGICSGCLRTINEITQWRHLDEKIQINKISQIRGQNSTHHCPSCGDASFCDISAGKDHCWCFDIEKRDLTDSPKANLCMCRRCLSSLPIE